MNESAQFHVGQRVISKEFTNCFGKLVPEVRGLVVKTVTRIDGIGIDTYFRVFAEHLYQSDMDCDVRSVEGAERFFEAEVSR
jgi:hypothetical protein